MDKKNNNILGGTLLIVAGLLVLAANFNLISRVVWSQIWKLWPVILIAIGLKKIIGR